MRKFSLFLENKNDLNDIIEILKTYKKGTKLLFRGTSKNLDEYGSFNVRKDRKSANTLESTHNALNKAFKDTFGVNVRSETVFVTGDNEMAESYGHVMIVIPKSPKAFYTNSVIDDLFYVTDTLYSLLTAEFLYDDEADELIKKLADKKVKGIKKGENPSYINFEDVIVHLDYKDYSFIFDRLMADYEKFKNIEDIPLKSIYHEIMIDCEEYYYVRYTPGIKMDTYSELLAVLEKINK